MSSSDLKVLKPLVLKIMYFMLPLFVVAVIVFLVDPFGRFGITLIVNDQVKKEIAMELDPVLWEYIQFAKSPTENILLGDSRMAILDVKTIKTITGESYFNFAYGGGTLPEAIDTFWLAANKVKLKNVYINMSLTMYNRYNNRNRLINAQFVFNHPGMSLINSNAMQTAYYQVKAEVFHRHTQLGKPSMDKAHFWQQQLANNFLYHYEYPAQQVLELKKISNYCKSHGINLTFVILPTHVDLQRKIFDYHLEQADRTYRRDLEQMGRLLDFDYPNPLTANYDNFADPFHFNKPTSVLIVKDIWGSGQTLARRSGLPPFGKQ